MTEAYERYLKREEKRKQFGFGKFLVTWMAFIAIAGVLGVVAHHIDGGSGGGTPTTCTKYEC